MEVEVISEQSKSSVDEQVRLQSVALERRTVEGASRSRGELRRSVQQRNESTHRITVVQRRQHRTSRTARRSSCV